MSKGMKFILIGAFLLFLIVHLSPTIDQPSQAKSGAENATSTPENANAAPMHDKEISGWRYWETKDKMRGTSTKNAAIDSDNLLSFDFPYSGGSRGTIQVYKTRTGSDGAIFAISKGQILCGVEGCDIYAKFDKGKVQDFVAKASDNGDTSYIIIDAPARGHEIDGYYSAGRFVSQLKKSHHVIIEAPFYDEGSKQLEFSTAGLKW